MASSYTHLNEYQREQLYVLQQQSISKQQMAMELGCHRSTIYRELARNKRKIGYLPDRAQFMSEERRSKPLKIEGDFELKQHIINQLEEGWSLSSGAKRKILAGIISAIIL